MVKFKTFFAEALGKFPKTSVPSGVEGALKEPVSPEEKQQLQKQREIIGKYKQKRSSVYPDGKYNFQLVDGFKGMLANAWRALPKQGESGTRPYSVLVLGDPGIGKSEIITSTARKLKDAENKYVPSQLPDGQTIDREYIEWNKAGNDKKREIMTNPERYYVFMDIRTAYLTTAGMEGLPVPENDKIDKSQFFRALPQQFISFITNPEAAGVLFLDEINQASREVQATLYQIINDRVFKDQPISPRILILAAANLGVGTTSAMEAPLSSRFVGAVLVPDPDAWFDWAVENDLDNVIVDYVRTDPENTFFKYPTEEGDALQWPNPRAIVRFNTQFKKLYSEYERLKQVDPEQARRFNFREQVVREAKAGLGPEWGEGFEQYLRTLTDIDLDKLASSGEEYKKLPSISKQAASTKLIQRILSEIDDAITSPTKSREVGSPPIKTYPIDETKLDTNLKTVVKPLLLNNSPEANIKIFKALKAREPDYLIALIEYLAKDDAFFKLLSSLEQSIPDRNEQI